MGGLAAEIAFFCLLSVFPAMLTLAAALSSIDSLFGHPVARPVEDNVVDFLQRLLTDQASGAIGAVRRLFDQSNSGAITIGAVLGLWSASRGFVALIQALDIAYDIEERRSYVGLRLTALFLALGTVVVASVVLTMLIVGPLFATGQDMAERIGVGRAFAVLWDWARWPFAVALMLSWAGTLLHLAPNHRTPWRWDLPGALLAVASWSLLSLGFHLYLSFAVGGANPVLGTLGGALIVLLWLYLLAMGLLLGGELNAVLARRYHVEQVPRSEVAFTKVLYRKVMRRIARSIQRPHSGHGGEV